MDKAIINSNSVEIKPARTAKSGKALKAVFGRWEGASLVTAVGRLASRKDYGTLQGIKGANSPRNMPRPRRTSTRSVKPRSPKSSPWWHRDGGR